MNHNSGSYRNFLVHCQSEHTHAHCKFSPDMCWIRCLPTRKVRKIKNQKEYFCINQTAQARVTVPHVIMERRNNGPYHLVLVTPLGAHNTLASVAQLLLSTARHGLVNRPSVEHPPCIIEKVILKATVKEGKEFKLFVLRNIE